MSGWNVGSCDPHAITAFRCERMHSARREPGLVEAIGQRLASAVVSCHLRLWHRLTVRGAANLPRSGPFVLIANHTSHLDALSLAALLPWRLRRTTYLLAADDVFFETPARALLSSMLLNALPMQRRRTVRHALADLRLRLVEDRCTMVMFPEGTRSATGVMQPFKAGLGMLVAGTDVPVVPCHINGAFAAWPRDARWPRPRRVSVQVGAPMAFGDVANDRDGWTSIAERMRLAVQQAAAVP